MFTATAIVDRPNEGIETVRERMKRLSAAKRKAAEKKRKELGLPPSNSAAANRIQVLVAAAYN